MQNDFQSKVQNINSFSGLNLAYMGDAVFELLVREMVLSKGSKPQKQLNKEVQKLVNAAA